ncbi:MAG: hypothetical protein KKE77_12785 [Alphaproteobacteria bacterium]|nr:hypothetical protein [Alphaproteobacteria bacterium]
MKALQRRVDALDRGGRYLTLGEVLDHLDRGDLPEGRAVNPVLKACLAALPDA